MSIYKEYLKEIGERKRGTQIDRRRIGKGERFLLSKIKRC